MCETLSRSKLSALDAASFEQLGRTPSDRTTLLHLCRGRRNDRALQRLCEQGHTASVRWLVHAFNLTAADARTWNNDALRTACSTGNLAVARLLAGSFQLDGRRCPRL